MARACSFPAPGSGNAPEWSESAVFHESAEMRLQPTRLPPAWPRPRLRARVACDGKLPEQVRLPANLARRSTSIRASNPEPPASALRDLWRDICESHDRALVVPSVSVH